MNLQKALDFLLYTVPFSLAQQAVMEGTGLVGFREMCLETGEPVFEQLGEDEWQKLFESALQEATYRFIFYAEQPIERLAFEGKDYASRLQAAKKYAAYLAGLLKKPIEVYAIEGGQRGRWVYTAEPPE
jgi:hypothetical protein